MTKNHSYHSSNRGIMVTWNRGRRKRLPFSMPVLVLLRPVEISTFAHEGLMARDLSSGWRGLGVRHRKGGFDGDCDAEGVRTDTV